MQVRNLMKQPVVTVAADQSVRQAARRMQEHVIGSVVVTDGDRLAGILTERDVLHAVAEDRDLDRTPAGDLMTTELVTAAPNWDVVVAASVMTSNRIRHLVVKNNEQLLGVLSLRDVLSVYLPDQVHEQ
ncbi:MAG TPA: CBS domain-containing protein [Actinomycetes bacterium]|nr:CBS domain-containing protein [Actinomycetes bacterium]